MEIACGTKVLRFLSLSYRRFVLRFQSMFINIISLLVGSLICLVIILIPLVIIYFTIDSIGYSKALLEYETGVISNKYYNPDKISTGIGTTIDANGQLKNVVTVNSNSENFIIELKLVKSNKKIRIDTDEQIYDKFEIGQKVRAYYKISKYTNNFSWTGDFEQIE